VYVSAISSLHPIDLANIVMNYAHFAFMPDDTIFILIMKDLEVPDDLRTRILTPRIALPTPLLLLEDEEIYRQVFLPLTSSCQNNRTSVDVATHIYKELLQYQASSVQLQAVEKRIEDLLVFIDNSCNDLDGESVLAKIIEYIFQDIIKKRVKIASYTDFLYSSEGQKLTVQGILRLIDEILYFRGEGKSFTFVKGGHIELIQKNNPDKKCEVDLVEIGNQHVTLTNSRNSVSIFVDLKRQNITVNTQEHQEINSNDFLWELRGPLNMVFQRQIGIPVDVPWYCENVDFDVNDQRAYIGLEAVSPISVAAQERVSNWAGGSDIRLYPSAYSLLEFDHPLVKAFIASVCHLPIQDVNEKLSDWLHLINNYPVSKQKALKHQGGVSLYIELKLAELRQQLKDGDLQPMIAIASEENQSPAEIGLRGLCLMAINKYMRDCMATSSVTWSDAQLERMEELGVMRNGSPAIDTVTKLTLNLLKESAIWRHNIAQSSSVVDTIDTDDPIVLVNSLARKNFTDSDYVFQRNDSFLPLNVCYRCLQEELTMYYKAVLALCSSVLKANIWTCWMLLGTNDYIEVCKTILSQRAKGRFFLSSLFWEER
jgi:hypothetical protein